MSGSAGPDLRLGDAERDRAAQSLGEHFAQGRLTAEEHGERTERAYAARTHADLRPLFADLPGGSPVRPPSSPSPAVSRPSYRRPRRPLWPLRIAAVVLLVALVVSHLPLLLLLLVGAWVVTVPLRRSRGSWPRCGPHPGRL